MALIVELRREIPSKVASASLRFLK